MSLHLLIFYHVYACHNLSVVIMTYDQCFHPLLSMGNWWGKVAHDILIVMQPTLSKILM